MGEFAQYIKDGWKKRAATAQRAREQAEVKLLPSDLQQNILQACDRERAVLVSRVGWIDAEIERIEALIVEARAAEADALEVYHQSPIRRRRWDGTIWEISQPAIRIKGKAAIAAGQRVYGLATYREALVEERAGRLGQIGDVQIVENQTLAGLTSGVLSITRGWTNRLEIGTDFLPPAARGAVLVDAANNELTPLQAEVSLSGRVGG